MTQFLLPILISPKNVPVGNEKGVPGTAGIPEEEAECRGRATSTNRECKRTKTTQSGMQVAGRPRPPITSLYGCVHQTLTEQMNSAEENIVLGEQ